MKEVRHGLAMAAAMSAVAGIPATGVAQSPGAIPGMEQMDQMMIASCYSARGREKRLWDLGKEINLANHAIAAERDSATLEARRAARDGLWRRYKDLGGRGDSFEDAPRLSTDPCLDVKEAIAKPTRPATGQKPESERQK